MTASSCIDSDQSFISFMQQRSNPEKFKVETQKHKADSLTKPSRIHYDIHLIREEYCPVIGAIWRDKKNRFTFLATHSGSLHIPLMLEEALATFEAFPRVEIINKVSIPLIAAAIFRIQQDLACLGNISHLRVEENRLIKTYFKELDRLIQKKLDITLSQVLEKRVEERNTAIMEKIYQVSKASIVRMLPSISWTRQLGYGEMNIQPKHLYERLRRSFAEGVIVQYEKQRRNSRS